MKARIAGLLYLFVIVAGVFAEIFVRQRLVVAGDAAATAHNILAHEMLYRLGFAAELLACACNMPLAFIFYDLFKVVNRSFAWLVVLFTLLGTAVEAAALLADYAPLVLLGGSRSLAAIGAAQLQGLAYASLQVFEKGFAVALVFFGFYCLALGYLIVRSIFFPRIIGVLLGIEGLCYLTNSFANFLAPVFAAHFFPYLAASAVAEISLMLWLLVVGVNAQRWKEQAGAAGIQA
ncbi:MAG TPA: DUF4386 domain-containing protein [Terriglobia bacterium]|nr:DUF4386 domain-containing protein [Terriglobia bacterium]